MKKKRHHFKNIFRNETLVYTLKFFLSVILINFEVSNAALSRDDDSLVIHTLKERIIELESTDFLGPDSIKKMLNSMRSDGSWENIEYYSVGVSPWPPLSHLSQYVLPLVKAYVNPNSEMLGNKELLNGIMRSLNFWLDHNFTSANWWANDIGVPATLSTIMILLDKEISYSQFLKGMNEMRGSYITQTGQNRAWRAGIQLKIGLIEYGRGRSNILGSPMDKIKTSSEILKEEVVVRDKEGIQPDWSFHQHGIQQQFGNYGLAFASTQANWIYILNGTPFQYPESKITIMRSFILNGISKVVWKGEMDISGMGRQLFPNSPAARGESVIQLLKLMAKADPAHAGEYNRIIHFNKGASNQPNPLVGNTYYWRSAMMVNRTSDSYISTRMFSRKIQSTESGNGENLLGAYLSDGATYIYLSGKEYDNIFPVWNWRRIPGITSYSNEEVPGIKWEGLLNGNDFVGGVSDSTFGISSILFERDGLRARKSNFYILDKLICLGSDITSNKNDDVSTTLNQCLSQGTVVIKRNNKIKSLTSDESLSDENINWVFHDQVGYIFPEKEKVTVRRDYQDGSWKRVHQNGSSENIEKIIFNLWIDHGSRPVNQSYAYVIVPKTTISELDRMEKKPDVKIIQNDSSIQAITSTSHNLNAAVFFNRGSVRFNKALTVSVDNPCLGLFQENSENLKVTLSTPPELNNTVHLTISGRYTCNACSYDQNKNKTIVRFDPFEGIEAGKSESKILQRPK